MTDNPPTFPKYWQSNYKKEPNIEHEGMSLRDYFAGQALIGFIISPIFFDEKAYAVRCYKIADAMLEARKVKNET